MDIGLVILHLNNLFIYRYICNSKQVVHYFLKIKIKKKFNSSIS